MGKIYYLKNPLSNHIFCINKQTLFVQQKKNTKGFKPPAPESAVITQEADQMGLKNSEEARLLSNFIKRYFYRELVFVSNNNIVSLHKKRRKRSLH